MSDRESLHFKIGLSGSFSGKSPEFKIAVDNNVQVHNSINESSGSTQYVEFDYEIDEGEHFLSIEFLNKLSTDTVKDLQGNIVEDLLLNIESIEIDDIELGHLIWNLSSYTPSYPEDYKSEMEKQKITLEETVKNCVNLGWNGTWKLPFTSPFYIWLLENI